MAKKKPIEVPAAEGPAWPPAAKPVESFSMRVVKDHVHMVVLGFLNNVERVRVACSTAEEMALEEAKVRATLREMALSQQVEP